MISYHLQPLLNWQLCRQWVQSSCIRCVYAAISPNYSKPFFNTAFACCRVRVRVSKQWSCEWQFFITAIFKFFLFAACALTHNTYLYATCKRHVVKGLTPNYVNPITTRDLRYCKDKGELTFYCIFWLRWMVNRNNNTLIHNRYVMELSPQFYTSVNTDEKYFNATL